MNAKSEVLVDQSQSDKMTNGGIRWKMPHVTPKKYIGERLSNDSLCNGESEWIDQSQRNTNRRLGRNRSDVRFVYGLIAGSLHIESGGEKWSVAVGGDEMVACEAILL
jgi:hypothetical protein